MKPDPSREELLFEAALHFPAGSERDAFLRARCKDDDGLLRRVMSLLAANTAAGDFMARQFTSAAVPGRLFADARVQCDPIEQPGAYIDRYKLLQKIGEGGCGVVYMAEQEEPIRRRVALKVIKTGMDTRAVIARFEAERQALAMMDHPNIARVLDVGQTTAGRPFFVMELVNGVRITEYCDQNNLSTRDRLLLFTQVCHAIQHAHQKGIIHRDIKPSNILVTLHDGIAVPKVIDFGIAKAIHQQRLTDRTLFTVFGEFIGTPAYMSPEQAERSGLDIDTRSDLYALGVLLYELLIGRTPFNGSQLLKAGLDEMRRIIREQEPPKPSTRLGTMTNVDLTTVAKRRRSEPARLIHLVRGDLDWIVMKCLEKDRTRRYGTASELAMDLARHLRHEPVLAGPPGSFYRLQKFVRRNRAMVSTGVTVAGALVFGVVGSTWLWRNAVEARRGESKQRLIAETNAAASLARLIRIDVANGERAMQNGDWYGALLWFTEALRQDKPGTHAEKMHRLRIGAFLNYSPRLMQAWFHDAAINHAVFSPDGQWVLTASRDKTARLWNVLSGQPGAVLPHTANVTLANFSANGGRMLTLSDDGAARVWDVATGQLNCSPLEHGYRVTHAVISPDGRRVFTLGDPGETNFTASFRDPDSEAGEVRIWDAASGRQVRAPMRYQKRISSLALSANGQWLAANLGKSVLIWNLREPRAIQFSQGKHDRTNSLSGLKPEQPSADLETLLPEIPRPSRMDEENRWIACLALSPDGERILTACGDGSARIWRLRDGAPLDLERPKTREAALERSQVTAAYFSPDGQRVLLLNDDRLVRLWDARTGESEGQIKGRASSKAWFSPDSRFLFAENSAQVWDLENDEAVTPNVPRPRAGFESAAFSPDGVMLLTAGSDGAARLWNLASGLPQQPPLKHDWTIVAARRAAVREQKPGSIRQQLDELLLTLGEGRSHNAFSADGKRVVTVSQNGSARVWEAATGAPITPYVIMDWPLDFAAFSPDGARFVTAGGSPPEAELGVARVWDARSGEPVTPVIRYPKLLRAASFSRDGRWLITQADRSAQVWDARTGEPVKLPAQLNAPICSASFSPDGDLIAVCEGAPAGGAWQTRLWNMRTGVPSAFSFGTNEISRTEFSPDGRWLLTLARHDDDFSLTARLWNVATGQPLTSDFWASGWPKPVYPQDGRRCFITGLVSEPVAFELPSGRALSQFEWRGFKMDPMAVTPDGERFAARDDRHLRVYDGSTGEPLTPPLATLERRFFGETIFSPDGNFLLVPGKERAQLWPLGEETRPVEELVLLAQLLAARRIDPSGNLVMWKSADASPAWRMLRAKYPNSFAVVPEQVRHWRERIIETSEREERWNTAAFHLDHLVKANPRDEALRFRHTQARNHAAMEELR